MESSSRIFIKGLPPSITEQEFRKHFAARDRQVTDVKLIPKRRIGYVGYKSPIEASSAVKYFNRSYIRMSKLAVELAKPFTDPTLREEARTFSRNATTTHVTGNIPEKASPPATENNRKKRKREDLDENDPKLREFLHVMRPGPMAEVLPEVITSAVEPSDTQHPQNLVPDGESDEEYEAVPAKKKKNKQEQEQEMELETESRPEATELAVVVPSANTEARPSRAIVTSNNLGSNQSPALIIPQIQTVAGSATDDDWLRSRTNRILDLVDAGDINFEGPEGLQQHPVEPLVGGEGLTETEEEKKFTIEEEIQAEEAGADGQAAGQADSQADTPSAAVGETARLFVRNIPYGATEEELREHFSNFGGIDEVHIPVDKSGTRKGFAFVQFADSSPVDEAIRALDGAPFQGRLLHIIPAETKRSQGLDEFSLSKLPLKKQNLIRKRAQAATTTFNWNALFMSQDAVNASVADRLGVAKSELLDPTSADAAVKQAIAETNVIQETKAYFAANGVDLDAFKSRKRGDTAILVKNFAHGTSLEEIRSLFEVHGTVMRVLMPPSGTIAIVQFAQPAQGKTAFARLAYTRFKESVLFLEKGPSELFGKGVTGVPVASSSDDHRPPVVGTHKLSASDLLERNDEEGEEEALETSSLFVRNLSFATTTAGLVDAFKSLEGFVSARVKTKTDANRPGEVLSMGFGFLDFRTKADAMAALKAMNGFVLDGHALSVKPSHKASDAAEERRREDKAKKLAARRTKIIIKNLPFEASKKDVRTLFGSYGQLRSVRVPKKFDRSRGFAFAEFITPREAENAIKALRDTHLLGRRLVLDYAEAEAVDPEEEIERMQKKIENQVDTVRMQELTGRARTRVIIDNGEGEAEEG